MWQKSPILIPLFLISLSPLVHTGLSPQADLPESGDEQQHQRHALSMLEPELAKAVWSRDGLRNPLRRTTTVPLTELLGIGGGPAGQQRQQQQQKEKPAPKRLPRAAGISEYDALNTDFLTEYDLLNLDFSLDESPKNVNKEVEVPSKDLDWEEEKEEKKEEFPPKDWWGDGEEQSTQKPDERKNTPQKPLMRGTKLWKPTGDSESNETETEADKEEEEEGKGRKPEQKNGTEVEEDEGAEVRKNTPQKLHVMMGTEILEQPTGDSEMSNETEADEEEERSPQQKNETNKTEIEAERNNTQKPSVMMGTKILEKPIGDSEMSNETDEEEGKKKPERNNEPEKPEGKPERNNGTETEGEEKWEPPEQVGERQSTQKLVMLGAKLLKEASERSEMNNEAAEEEKPETSQEEEDNGNKTESTGRMKRSANKLKAGGVANLQGGGGRGDWSGEAVARDQVKVWPRLILSTTARTTTTTTRRPRPGPTQPKAAPPRKILNPNPKLPVPRRRIVTGGEDQEVPSRNEPPAKKAKQDLAELQFRDLPPSGVVEVASALIEKAVEPSTRQQNNFTQLKSTNTKQQQQQQFSRVLDQNIATGVIDSGGFGQRHSEQGNGHSIGQSQLIDSFPKIIVGEQQHKTTVPDSRNRSTGRTDFGFSNGQQQPPAIQVPPAVVGQPADPSIPLPPGFVHLATLDELPPGGQLQIGDRRYVIEQTLPFRHFFSPEAAPPLPPKARISNNGNEEFKQELPQLLDPPSLLEVTQPTKTEQTKTGEKRRRRRLAPMQRHGADQPKAESNFPNAPGRRKADHSYEANEPNKAFRGKTGAVALNLGSALSQIFGNFSLPNAEDERDKKARHQSKLAGAGGRMTRFGGAGGVQEVDSEQYRLTRVFERKPKARRSHGN